MFSKILVKTFIRDSENVQNTDVRNKYGYVAGVVGILSNLLLFVIKVFIGMFTSSIAIMADAFNNLSDMASSAITMIGFKLASKPADKEHPFGHGRIEYLSALIVAFMVMLVGLQFVKSSIERIVNPIPVKFEVIPLILLIASIMIKIWLSRFNKFVGNKIDSSALKAVSLDALGDVFTSSCVVISFIVARFTNFPSNSYFEQNCIVNSTADIEKEDNSFKYISGGEYQSNSYFEQNCIVNSTADIEKEDVNINSSRGFRYITFKRCSRSIIKKMFLCTTRKKYCSNNSKSRKKYFR
ncbi:cation efflux protein [Clostridioides difficile]|nr:cation efflux protein [Clostridioides difficile]